MRGFMHKIKNYGRFTEILRFAVNGFVSFLVDYGALYVLTEFCGFYYLVSSAISFIASVTVNYLICVLWVFKGADGTGGKAKIIFIASSVVGLGINQLLMWLFVTQIGLYYMIAKIIATVVVMAWNYVMKRKALYMKKKDENK